ncbi:MAG: penicillin-binding transpeptidase domain-containing protein [Oscillospiraceae bacterium]|nr:penicillin-binding transpeptidase domain-containing protein [Oscillospiraceae bacterium]
MSVMAKGPTRTMWVRMMIVMLVLGVGMLGVTGVRLATIMIADSEFYQEKAAEQQLYDTVLSPTRGDIYDRNMNTLATSATVWTVYITPNDFPDISDEAKRAIVKQDIANHLATILELNVDDVLAMTAKSSSYVIVKKQVEKPEADKIREYISTSEYGVGNYIGLDESTKRYYPNDNLASVLMGFVGSDNQGLSGLESYYDKDLTGTSGRVVAAKNAHGADMPFSYEKVVDATAGNSLVLTIDKFIQYVCEKNLEQAIIDNKIAERGACVVMNVNTGEILAMAVKGDFDPNDPFTLSAEDKSIVDTLQGDERTAKLSELRNRQWRNKAISDTYEPGSVFKIVTASAAIEEDAAKLTSTYNCPGYIVVAGNRYKCHKLIGHGTLTLTGAMQQSCNPAFITMGQQLGATTFSKYFEAFGLTEKTGIDLPGESASVYHRVNAMGPTELASTSFGQTFKITPIQLITAVSAAVNGGYLVQPHAVNEIVDKNGNTISKVDSTVKRQVISTNTSEIMRQLLEAVVDGGGGKNAYVAGYRIGAKTGTSQKVAEMLATGKDRLYIGSTVGVAPMDDPEIAVLMMLDQPPMGAAYYGGTIAAPSVGQILSEILPYMGFEPQYTEKQLETLAISVPNVVGNSVSVAKSTVTSSNLKYKVIGSGSTVISQMPASTQSIYQNGVVVLYTDETSTTSIATVPDFTGLTVSAANKSAANAGINIEFSGTDLTTSGVVAYRQDYAAGLEVESGTVITVYFRSLETAE